MVPSRQKTHQGLPRSPGGKELPRLRCLAQPPGGGLCPGGREHPPTPPRLPGLRGRRGANPGGSRQPPPRKPCPYSGRQPPAERCPFKLWPHLPPPRLPEGLRQPPRPTDLPARSRRRQLRAGARRAPGWRRGRGEPGCCCPRRSGTMGCCTGRCTLIFLCALQLVSGAAPGLGGGQRRLGEGSEQKAPPAPR